jgi:5-formaminoimidazole-4-carboxamide-1-(beta)-D-ribofuranosyl 5'-monophosphate synthetase
VLDWESDRTRQRDWLMRSQIRIPYEFQNGNEIKKAVIVKLFGAEGGTGHLVVH